MEEPIKTADKTEVQDLILDQKVSNFKKYLIGIILATILILGAIIVIIIVSRAQTAKRVNEDKMITNAMFELRLEAQTFYNQNQSYKDWAPNTDLVNKISQNESVFQIKKPDYQNYLIAAYLPGSKQYFCIDSYGTVDQIQEIKNNQVKCKE